MTTTTRGLLAGVAALTMMVAANSALAQSRTFNLPAQSAVDAIPAFARQAGVQIIVPSAGLRGVGRALIWKTRAAQVSGVMLLIFSVLVLLDALRRTLTGRVKDRIARAAGNSRRKNLMAISSANELKSGLSRNFHLTPHETARHRR